MHVVVLGFFFLASVFVNWSYVKPEDYESEPADEFTTPSITGLEHNKPIRPFARPTPTSSFLRRDLTR